MKFETAIRARQVADTWKDRNVFWPKFTIGDLMEAIMSIHDPVEAQEFQGSYLEWQRSQPTSDRHTPEQIVLANIGWCFGEGMDIKDIQMWATLGNSHPIFGVAAPSPQKAFSLGLDYAVERNQP